MRAIVTRADGQPAHFRAKPRLRQSHFDALRKFPARYAELRAEEADLARHLGEEPQPHPAFGAIMVSGLFGILIIMVSAFAIMTGGFQ